MKSLRSQTVILEKKGSHSKYLATVFDEQGIAMLASVLRSEVAASVSVQIMRAFVAMRKFLKSNADIFIRLDNLEQRQSSFQMDSNAKFDQLFTALESGEV